MDVWRGLVTIQTAPKNYPQLAHALASNYPMHIGMLVTRAPSLQKEHHTAAGVGNSMMR